MGADMTPLELSQVYLQEQKTIAFVLITVGAASAAISIFFLLYYRSKFVSGMVIPLGLFAALQIFYGVILPPKFNRTKIENQKIYSEFAEEKFIENQIRFMEKEIQGYQKLYIIYAAIIIFALAVMIFSSKQWWMGFGFALFIQMALCFCIEYKARYNTQQYILKIVDYKTQNREDAGGSPFKY